MQLRPTPIDSLIIILIAIAIITSAMLIWGGDAMSVHIRTREGEYRYALNSTLEKDFSGPLGQSAVHIENNKVWISDSPCKTHSCITSGTISHKGQTIACLPNDIIITIEGREKGEADAVSR